MNVTATLCGMPGNFDVIYTLMHTINSRGLSSRGLSGNFGELSEFYHLIYELVGRFLVRSFL